MLLARSFDGRPEDSVCRLLGHWLALELLGDRPGPGGELGKRERSHQLRHGVDELSAWLHEPLVDPPDDLRRADLGRNERHCAACHRLDHHVTEAFGDRGQNECVGSRKQTGDVDMVLERRIGNQATRPRTHWAADHGDVHLIAKRVGECNEDVDSLPERENANERDRQALEGRARNKAPKIDTGGRYHNPLRFYPAGDELICNGSALRAHEIGAPQFRLEKAHLASRHESPSAPGASTCGGEGRHYLSRVARRLVKHSNAALVALWQEARQRIGYFPVIGDLAYDGAAIEPAHEPAVPSKRTPTRKTPGDSW